ncbi:glycerol-3-phosphate cytidylyltransferase [Candidatus Roizmanbacteria bacterium CG_4_9_14_0_2_um_filter_39_13]|uniref:Glycerol-3-phosphate cytidylyltransferase n=2 Tax=Candidatus Roizmaniibacteriota TaxID=1752723 RepID=A0A2M8EXT3_9BACT|nr:MAG: glycerol-3-phosphate cytidylyltransferase [Candidatus Roizmanbacteria bacterium CG_4_10_14_0_2_um_filter_39_12]PJC30960.1 MAG: glycerol-3-phosphate cytidylyltransferase [Candidatus Roizmanbacteria bacterium CG_4_9_14_0_2_um_filter_39_13]PJE61269.1 MAG: glycerol-3-phosphate cytidylyltransferase [Candidatus Roizmanbacteria bacterium CG10_big_fil_rev_8_21_14_0_10_39_12]
MKKKIWKHEDLGECIYTLKNQKIVLVGGCYDLLHFGHHTFLQNAKNKGDVLLVALESDEHIMHKKNRQPIHTQQERAEILAALSYIDAIILLSYMSRDDEYRELVQNIKPSVIAVTAGDPLRDKKARYAQSIGAEIVEVTSLIPRFATSAIIESFSE